MQIKEKRVTPTNLPIDFFQFNVEDFKDGFKIKDNTVNKIEPDNDGFIGAQIMNLIELSEKNTTVINCGVGQGKSTLCIQIGDKYIKDRNIDGSNKWVLIYAAPYKSIIKDYYQRLIDIGVTPNQIFDYQELTNDNFKLQFAKPFHIITTNTIMGDYGDEAFKQKEIKEVYLHSIIEYCDCKYHPK